MSAFLHQIFYANNKFDSGDIDSFNPRTPLDSRQEFFEVVDKLSQWSIPRPIYLVDEETTTTTTTKNAYKEAAHESRDVRGITGEDVSTKVTKVNIQLPAARPRPASSIPTNLSIFKSIFILQYGYGEYMMEGNRINNREFAEKQKIMEVLSKTPKKLKDGNQKLTNDNIQEILSGLYVSTKEEIMQLVAYSVYYNRIIYLVFQHSYLVVSPTKDATVDETNIDTVFVLYQTRKHPKYGGSYVPEMELTLEKLNHIHNNKIHLEHYAKPFKGISTYKICELETIANKIGLLDQTHNVKYKKKELYDKIVEICCVGICA